MSEQDFHPIDQLFAEQLCPGAPQEASFFLASLLKSAREGHMFLSTEGSAELERGASFAPEHLFDQYLVRDGKRIYLKRNWECEQLFLSHLKRLKRQKPALLIDQEGLSAQLKQLPLTIEQSQAIMKCAASCLTLISGGPGTGKTFTATTLIRLFMEWGIKKIVVAAPTGKATANIRKALGPLAEQCIFKTLHALVRQPRVHADLVVVDEGSMVDAQRMAALFASLQEGARLILLGDKDQLPPIESGNFFADMAHDPTLIAELTTCLRCELKEIVDLADQVKRGFPIEARPLPDMKSLLALIMEKKAHVLTPLKKGLYGADYLNQTLYQAHLARHAKEIPIMVCVNDPHLDLFNGDTGVLRIDEKQAHFSEGRTIPEYRLPHYTYAYVISVHKSQGSEYDNTLILLPKGSEIFGREMLYTAITRAKRGMTILADEGVIEELVKRHYRRRSGIDKFFDEAATC